MSEKKLTVEWAKNPVCDNERCDTITLDVKFFEFDYPMPFTADPNDCTSYGPEIYRNAKSEMYGYVVPYEPPPARQVTTATINKAVTCLSDYSFTNDPTFQTRVTAESRENIRTYLTEVDNILAVAQQAYDNNEAYAPNFPAPPAIHMTTPAGNKVEFKRG